MMKYVIIGLGIAAVGCVEGIRSLDKAGDIAIIAGEGRPAYCRPLISYLLKGKTDIDKMRYGAQDFYEKNGCELINATAVGVNGRDVILDDGRTIEFDALCLATGSVPLAPPFEGLDAVKNKFGFMTLDDALALDKAITPDSRVLIIGAGLIGLKCAEGICERVRSVAVCDLAPYILSSALDEESAGVMQKALEARGISFMLSDTVSRFENDAALMRSGNVVGFDILVLAVGVRPNTSLFTGKIERGIVVDEHMRTSVDSIYAAGDCAQGYDSSLGENRVLAIMPNARLQGRCAGKNMAGGDEVFLSGIPMNAVGFFGVHALSAGCREGDMFETTGENALKRLYVKDNRLVGFTMVGDVDKAGIYTALIRERTPLDEVDFELLRKSPSLAAFSANYRGKTLGGVV